MDKNSLQESKQLWKGYLSLITLVATIAGLLWGRGLASVAMFLFGVNALWDVHPKRWFSQKWWLFGLAWVGMYALSYFWSANVAEWGSHLQVKLPFLLLPLAFGFAPAFTPLQLRIFTWSLTLMVCGAACYSIAPLFHSSAELIESYKRAHVLPTAMYNDHIAFSATAALTVAWLIFYLPAFSRKWERVLLGLLVGFLCLYLHILAAKTGLLALYILLAGIIVFQLWKAPKRGLLIVLLAAVSIGAAYTFIPTFRERIGYSLVTWRSYESGERDGIYSDAGRIISYNLSLRSIKSHPLIGVGAGDVLDEMKTGYARYYPEVPEEQMLWPHNQFLTTAMAVGIPGALLLLLWMAWPLRCVRKNREGFFFVIVWLMLLVPLMVDLILEVQAGVGFFLIFLLWQRSFVMRPVSGQFA